MRSERRDVRFLLDEHYPGWLAEELSEAGVDTVALNAHRPELRGVNDKAVLEAALAENRVVVTEDVTTFRAAITLVPSHVGAVFCHHARYPRTRRGLDQLRRALIVLAAEPPEGLGIEPVEWWLPPLRE